MEPRGEREVPAVGTAASRPGRDAEPGAGGTARGRSTRAALLQATGRLVQEVGYAGTTIRAVAQAAGIAEGTIYRHFPDKDSLLLAAAAEQHAPIVEELRSLSGLAGRGEVVDTLSTCLQRLQQMRETLLPLELAVLTDPGLAAARGRLDPRDVPDVRVLLAAYLSAEQDLGRLRDDVDADEAASLLLVTLFGLTAAPALAPPGVVRVPTVRRVVELLLSGLAPPR